MYNIALLKTFHLGNSLHLQIPKRFVGEVNLKPFLMNFIMIPRAVSVPKEKYIGISIHSFTFYVPYARHLWPLSNFNHTPKKIC